MAAVNHRERVEVCFWSLHENTKIKIITEKALRPRLKVEKSGKGTKDGGPQSNMDQPVSLADSVSWLGQLRLRYLPGTPEQPSFNDSNNHQ